MFQGTEVGMVMSESFEECGGRVTGSPGEPECEDVGLLCRRGSHASRPCAAVVEGRGPGWARDMDVTGLGQAGDALGGGGQGVAQLEVGRRETGGSAMTAACLVPSDW